MDGITLTISGTFKGAFEEIANQMPNIEKRALYHAAYFLRDEIRKSFKSKLPKADQRNPRYSDTLLDAVGFSKVDGASLNVNAMGNRKSSSGTYRARFFEAGTKDRYQKTRNGIRLKKKLERLSQLISLVQQFKPIVEWLHLRWKRLSFHI